VWVETHGCEIALAVVEQLSLAWRPSVVCQHGLCFRLLYLGIDGRHPLMCPNEIWRWSAAGCGCCQMPQMRAIVIAISLMVGRRAWLAWQTRQDFGSRQPLTPHCVYDAGSTGCLLGVALCAAARLVKASGSWIMHTQGLGYVDLFGGGTLFTVCFTRTCLLSLRHTFCCDSCSCCDNGCSDQ
jgi:hypothetical protein